jgi:pyridoxal phosphate enzyme (YggS family)
MSSPNDSPPSIGEGFLFCEICGICGKGYCQGEKSMSPVSAGVNIAENYRRVLDQVQQAARRAGREPASVNLVVVTKTHPPEAVRQVVEAGARDVGESYVEEALPKMESLPGSGIRWHMIGHIQSRKAALVAGGEIRRRFDLIHSLDSLKLARKIDSACQKSGLRQRVLLECNVSGEASKSGFPAWTDELQDRLLPELEALLMLPGLEVLGLMTIPPLLDDPERARPYFRKLRELRDSLSKRFPAASWGELSMGMSGDFACAIQEGATWVRVGTAIMGPRL